MKQLVYRQKFNEALAVQDLAGVTFRHLSSPLDAFRLGWPLFRCLGLPGLLKAGVKLATGTRQLYCIVAEGRVAHYGWLSFSFCRYYTIKAGDIVVGPILTDERARGRGYATLALKHAINHLMAQDNHVFWIDTSEDNTSCRKVIEKCGFGGPVQSFERPGKSQVERKNSEDCVR
jgi:hypothetical protein